MYEMDCKNDTSLAIKAKGVSIAELLLATEESAAF